MIILPSLFAQKLAQNPSLLSDVQASFAAFEPWLAHSGMPFFPGFTDHSPTHISDVLSSAASLISDSSHNLITPEDVSVLCMAILLHDSGMHLTADSFRLLITDSNPPIVSGFGDLPWSQLWKDFLGEVQRFGQEKLLAIFGDATPLRIDALDVNNLTEKDHLLIGEFVRRHHTRLAHEIAIVGVGRLGSLPIKLEGFNDALCDISGLIARSHGLPIRGTFDYLRAKYGNVAVCRKIKVPFLMAILRIADYIQVKSERAIAGLLSVKELRSPISRQEWRNHFAISDVHTYHADPEAIFVEAAPVDVRTFSKLAALFKDIQRELDESWATLGEVYGRMGELDKLGLNSRRIRSTLDSIEEFSKTVPYIPIAARFDSSGPDLLKLLVGPLYDYQIAVGLRELMQNAIDACREAHDLYLKRGIEKLGAQTDVTVEIVEEDGEIGYVLISDNGVGMTVETVTRYFLIAGASFRNSDIWKRQHTDMAGRPKISRGGRFGIGALAAFLLGEEINITTRHIDRASHEGITFTARIDDPHVQLTKCTAPQGTSFKIAVSDPSLFAQLRPNFGNIPNEPNVFKLQDWRVADWFVQAKPSLIVKWSGYNISERNTFNSDRERFWVNAEFSPPSVDLVPNVADAEDLFGWNRLGKVKDYEGILWQYKKPQARKQGDEIIHVTGLEDVIVNGLRVQKLSRHRSQINLPEDELDLGPQYNLSRPSISIYDPSGICPINLQRSHVAFDRMNIDEMLARNILQFQIQNFVDAVKIPSTIGEFYSAAELLMKTQGLNFDGQVAPIGFFKGGLILLDSAIISLLKIRVLVIIEANTEDFEVEISSILPENALLIIRIVENRSGSQTKLGWFRGIFSPKETAYYARSIGLPLNSPVFQGSLMSIADWDFVNSKNRVARSIVEPLKTKEILGKKFVFSQDHSLSTSAEENLIEILRKLPSKSSISLWHVADEEIRTNSVLVEVWLQIVGGMILSDNVGHCSDRNVQIV